MSRVALPIPAEHPQHSPRRIMRWRPSGLIESWLFKDERSVLGLFSRRSGLMCDLFVCCFALGLAGDITTDRTQNTQAASAAPAVKTIKFIQPITSKVLRQVETVWRGGAVGTRWRWRWRGLRVRVGVGGVGGLAGIIKCIFTQHIT